MVVRLHLELEIPFALVIEIALVAQSLAHVLDLLIGVLVGLEEMVLLACSGLWTQIAKTFTARRP